MFTLRWLESLVAPVRQDIREDPKLRYLLLLGALLSVIGIWFRLPNFAGPDEYSRLIQPMKVAGRFVADPGFGSLQSAVTDGRALGATLYLYALVLAPIFVVILLTGQLGAFVTLGGIESRWTLWQEAPAWFWTSGILLGRLVTLSLMLASVYLLYRLGYRLRDRWTGRVAAAGLAVTFGFVESAHLINEDIPMVCLLLATLLLCLRYVESGQRKQFLLSCLTAAGAVAFKLTGGTAVLAVGAAYLLRGSRADDLRAALVRPKLLLAGLAVGVCTIVVGFPSVLVGGPGELVTRLASTTGRKTGAPGGVVAPIWFWLLHGYLSAYGLPLFVGIVAGLGSTGWAISTDGEDTDGCWLLVVVPVVVTLAVFSRWRFVRVHHLIPTLPFLLLLATPGLRRLRSNWPTGIRVALAVLLVTSAVFTGLGSLQIATDPRDEATDWLRTNTDPEAEVEVYENSIADVAAVHGRPVTHYDYQEDNATLNSSLVLDERAYTEWMLAMPERNPDYIQLTGEELSYLNPRHPDYEAYPERRAYIRDLLDGSAGYRVAAEFGERPTGQSPGQQLLWAGLDPHPETTETVVIILERDNGTAG